MLRKVIASMQLENEPASIIKWSPISSSRFFIGTRNGNILCSSLKTNDDGNIVFKVDWVLSVNFDVNFLTFEPSFGDTLVVGSKKGLFSFVKRVHSSSPVLAPESYSICNENENEIYSCEFLESSSNYMLFVTKLGTILYTIAERETITLFNDVSLKGLYPVMSHGRRLIGLNDHVVALYELINGKVERLCEIQIMPSITNSHNNYEIAYVYSNDKLIFVSYDWWLTTIKIINKKLFVVSRVRLLHEKPLDFSPRGGSLLISTMNGCILSTRPTMLASKRSTRPSKSLDITNTTGKKSIETATTNKASDTQAVHQQQQQNNRQQIPSFSSQQQNNQQLPSFSSQQPQNNCQQIPSFSSQQQNNQQLPSFSSQQQNNQQLPSFSSQPQNNRQQIPSFSSQPPQNNQQLPSFSSQQQNNQQLPSFSSQQQNNQQLPSFSSQQPQNNQHQLPIAPNSGNSSSQASSSQLFSSSDLKPPQKLTEHVPSVSFSSIKQPTVSVPSMSSRSRRRISMNIKYSNEETTGTSNLLTGVNLNQKFDVEIDPSLQQGTPPPHVTDNDKMIAIQAMQSLKQNSPQLIQTPQTNSQVSPKGENAETVNSPKGKPSNQPASKIEVSLSAADLPDEKKMVSSPPLIKQSSSAIINEKAKAEKGIRKDSSDDAISQKATYGNSRQFNMCFKIADIPLSKVEWVGPNRVFAYGSVKSGDRYINKIYVLDNKTKTVYSILDKRLNSLNMPITGININSTRKVVAVVLNETVVNFISLISTPPHVISTINFTSSVLLTFSPDGNRAALMSDKTIYVTEMIDVKNANIKFKEAIYIEIKYNITALLWKRANLIAGTDDGKVLFINLETNQINEVFSIKNQINSIVDYENSQTQMILHDSKDNVFIISHRGVEKAIPYPVKCIRQVSTYDFIIRYYGKGRLSAFNMNNRIIPMPTPVISKCMVLKPREEWASLLHAELEKPGNDPIRTAEVFGMPLMRKILVNMNFPDFTREQITFIRDIILADSGLIDLAIHLCLDLGEVDRTRTIAFRTDGKSPSFVLNIFKAILFETNPRDEFVQAAIVHLITEGKARDAIDMLLIIGRLKDAVEKLMSIDELKEAQCILKMRLDDDKSLQSYMWEIAQRFIDSGRLGAGIIMYALSGGIHKITEIYKELGESEQTVFLEKVLA